MSDDITPGIIRTWLHECGDDVCEHIHPMAAATFMKIIARAALELAAEYEAKVIVQGCRK